MRDGPVYAPFSAVLVPHVGLLGVLVPCSVHVWLVPIVVQNLVNIGGANAHGYARTYRRLFGRHLEAAPDGSSFVTHWMVGGSAAREPQLTSVHLLNSGAGLMLPAAMS